MRFIIRQLIEFKKLLTEISIIVNNANEQRIKTEISSILRRFRSGIFSCEERIEYQSARNFNILEKTFIEISRELSYAETKEISGLLNQARIYNAKLERLGARGGKIEIALKQIQKNPKDKEKSQGVQVLIEEAIHNDLAFEAVINQLMSASRKIKKMKSKITGYQQLESLAIMIQDYEGIIVLYDQDKLRKEMENTDLFLERCNSPNPEMREIAKREGAEFRQKARRIPDSSGFGSNSVDYLENRMVDHVIVGYCEMPTRHRKEVFLGAYEILRIAAKPGMGLFFLELVLSWAALRRAPVIIDRKETSPAARKLWEYIDTEKPYILKYPAALLKYPEAIGYTKKEVLELFGPAVFGLSVFDENGFPAGLPKQKVEELKQKIGISEMVEGVSYLKKEATRSTNRVIGGIASLDKAYYYQGEIKTLGLFIKRGIVDKRDLLPLKMKNAGYVFFQESKARSGL